MAFTKTGLLDKAAEIAKAYAGSNGAQNVDTVLRDVYEELNKINEEIG